MRESRQLRLGEVDFLQRIKKLKMLDVSGENVCKKYLTNQTIATLSKKFTKH